MHSISKIKNNDYFLTVFSRIIVILVGILSTAFAARYLGVALRGEFGFITQAVNLLVLLLGMGFQQTYTYFYRKYDGNVLQRFLGLYMAQTAFYIVVAFFVCLIMKGTDWFYISLLCPFATLYAQMETAMTVENLHLKIKRQVINALLKCLMYAALLILRQYIGVNLLFPVLITAFIDVLTILSYFGANKQYRPRRHSFSRAFAGEATRFSWLPMITSVLVIMNYSLDVFFLRYMGTAEDLSWYTVAAGIINYVWWMPDAVRDVLTSRIARDSDTETINLSIKLSVALVVLLGIGFGVVGKFVVAILYGAEFVPTYYVTLILFIGSISMVFFKMIGVMTLAEGKRAFYFTVLLLSVIVNAAANLFSIPRWGMYGAAWASVLSYSVCGIAFLVYYLNYKKQRAANVLLIRKTDILAFLRKNKS